MRRGIALACTAAVPLALLVGCAQIPTTGPVDRGDQVQGPEDDPPVRVLPRGPVPGQTAIEVVKGFLDASASFEDDHAVARRFLTDGAAKTWNPEAGVTVIDDNPLRSFKHDGSSVELDAEQTAQITRDGSFLPRGGVPITRTFGMKKEGDFWRIADVPEGLVLDRIEVSLAFRAFDIYFMNPQPQDKQSFLVADPVYLPVEQSGSATSLVQALLDGPTRWLSPAVESMIPGGTRLVVESVPIENGVAQVDLSAEFLDADTEALEMAAAQITSTLLELSSSVTGVAISVEGSPLQLPSAPSVFTADTWEGFDPDSLSPAIGAVFVRGGVVRTLDDNGDSGRVQGALGDGRPVVVEPSQSWSGDIITALDRSHTHLLVTHPFVSSRVSITRTGAHLLPATIDGDNRLWLLDVGRQRPELRVLDGERWHRAILRAPRGDIESFQVSADGTRAAIVIRRESGGRGRSEPGQLMVGRVVQGANQLRVEAFRRIELTLRRARDASWVDATTLVVLGSSSGAAVEPLLVNIDRSVTSPSNEVAAGLTGVVGAPSLPLLADSDGDILEATGTGWQAVVRGEYPAYPG